MGFKLELKELGPKSDDLGQWITVGMGGTPLLFFGPTQSRHIVTVYSLSTEVVDRVSEA